MTMFSIDACNLPKKSLLMEYRANGAYTDCYCGQVDGTVSQREFIEAFYTTVPFRLERTILRWAVSKPSTDEEAHLLAAGKIEKFAAWYVEARRDDQLLLSDYRGRTRSWLMSEAIGSHSHELTRLYFGSAVVPAGSTEIRQRNRGTSFSALLLFHKLYSQILLAAARSRLSR